MAAVGLVLLIACANVAGLRIALVRSGLQPEELEMFYLAGGFAEHLDLDAARRIGFSGARGMGHPVAGYPDPFQKGQPLSCVSCHNPHAASLDNLLSDKFNSVKVCDECHQAVKAAAIPKAGRTKQ